MHRQRLAPPDAAPLLASSPTLWPAASVGSYRLAAMGLCAVAWALRCFQLGRQSLWFDEALSVSLAAGPLRALPAQLAQQDVHPPLYFALLHAWMLGAGMSEFAVRALSAGWSTLAVALLFVVGTRLGGRAVGLIAGAIGCTCPLLVYYGQEARMYALLCCLALLAAYAFLRASAGQPRWWWVASGALAGSLWTHLAASFLVLALDVR